MDKLEKSSWIINTTKHLNNFKSNSQELDCFQNTIFSGKTSMFMNKLVGTSDEIISSNKFKVFARKSFIEVNNIEPHLKVLKSSGLIDYSTDILGRVKEIENYCFSNKKSIEVASDIFEKRIELDKEEEGSYANIEIANIDLLNATFKRPIKEEEVNNIIKAKEEDIKLLLDTHAVFGITKRNRDIIYNEYIFTGDCEKIILGLNSLSATDRDKINNILDIINNHQGYISEKLEMQFDNKILKTMEGLGMIDCLEVKSNIGSAKFFTTPQLSGIGIGKFNLETDIFHSAKILLSCLRFGQEKSTYGRGKISTEEKMLNIIKKLNRGEWLNPCTAAGQDYTLLEEIGVIELKSAGYGMFQMRLRNKEVGKLVESMIKHNKVLEFEDMDLDILSNINAKEITNPEERRNHIWADENKVIAELRENVLHSLRK